MKIVLLMISKKNVLELEAPISFLYSTTTLDLPTVSAPPSRRDVF